MTDDGDDNDWHIYGGTEECGEHCMELTLHTKDGATRIKEKHCDCPWCHGGRA
jgi:hypothetical protein